MLENGFISGIVEAQKKRDASRKPYFEYGVETVRHFQRAMSELTPFATPPMDQLDFSPYKSIVDLGGKYKSQTITMCRLNAAGYVNITTVNYSYIQ